jgi:hypothetical protein
MKKDENIEGRFGVRKEYLGNVSWDGHAYEPKLYDQKRMVLHISTDKPLPPSFDDALMKLISEQLKIVDENDANKKVQCFVCRGLGLNPCKTSAFCGHCMGTGLVPFSYAYSQCATCETPELCNTGYLCVKSIPKKDENA